MTGRRNKIKEYEIKQKKIKQKPIKAHERKLKTM